MSVGDGSILMSGKLVYDMCRIPVQTAGGWVENS